MDSLKLIIYKIKPFGISNIHYSVYCTVPQLKIQNQLFDYQFWK